MKTKYFLLGFLIFSMIAVGTMIQVKAADTDYEVGVKKDDTRTWNVVKGHEDFEDTYGEEGDELKMKVTKVDESGDNWEVEVETTKGDEDPDDATLTIIGKEDDLEGNGLYISLWLIGKDTASYLKTAFKDVDDTEVTGSDLKAGDDEDYSEYSFDPGTGWLNSWKVYEEGELIFELGVPFIPGYELPILLGVTAISAASIIYITLRKKRM